MKQCKYCGGKGELICRDCSGSGYVSYAPGVSEPCTSCAGTGMVDCVYCSGLEYIETDEDR